MNPVTLSKSRARAIIIHAACLSKPNPFGKGPEAVYQLIDHLGYLQVDTNYVVERAHHHALASRISDYKTEWLEELQSEGRIYEFWTRDSGFMPMKDYRFSIPVQEHFQKHWAGIPATERSLMNRTLDRIGRDGPLRAKDFDNDRVVKSSGWWDWRPSKVALERLHLTGQLLATRKKDFHKLYDLTSNIVSSDVNKTAPTPAEYSRHLILGSLRALGVCAAKEIAWNGRFVKPPVKEELKKMVAAGEITEVNVEGLKGPYYMLPLYQKKRISIAENLFILSPFDTLNAFRHRLRDFFDFDYQVECFVPAPKRKYGYFSLPILAGDQFIARMDSKADRKSRTLIIHNLHFEKGKPTKAISQKLADAIRRFAAFNECANIRLVKSNSREFVNESKKTFHQGPAPEKSVKKKRTGDR